MESAKVRDQLARLRKFLKLKHQPSTAGKATDPIRVLWAAQALCQDAGIKIPSARTECASASTQLYDASAARSHAGITALKPLLQGHRRRTLSALQYRRDGCNSGERDSLVPETALQCALDAAAAPYHPAAEGLVSASTEPICRRELHQQRLAAYSELLFCLIEQVRLAEQAAMQSVKAAAKAVRKQGSDVAGGSVGSARSMQKEAVIRFAQAASSLRRERSAAPAPPAAVPRTELSSDGDGSGEHRPRASRPAAQAGDKRPRPDYLPETGPLHTQGVVLSNGQGDAFAGGAVRSNAGQARGRSPQERGPGSGEAGADQPQPELGRPALASGSNASEGGEAGAGRAEAASVETTRGGTQRHRGARRLPPHRPARGSARSLGASGRGRARSRGPFDATLKLSEGGLQDAVSFF